MMECAVDATGVHINNAELVVDYSAIDDVGFGRHFERLAIQVCRIFQIASKLLRWLLGSAPFHELFQGNLAQLTETLTAARRIVDGSQIEALSKIAFGFVKIAQVADV